MSSDLPSNSHILMRAIRSCKLLSILCKIAIGLICVWGIAVIALMVHSLLSSEQLILSGFAVPTIYLLHTINFCLVPIILDKIVSDISIQGTPFTLRNAQRLFALACVFIAYTALEALLIAADTRFLFMVHNDSVRVGNFIYDFASHSGTSINLFPVIIAAVFFALSYVFKYGVLLQQESDETL